MRSCEVTGLTYAFKQSSRSYYHPDDRNGRLVFCDCGRDIILQLRTTGKITERKFNKRTKRKIFRDFIEKC